MTTMDVASAPSTVVTTPEAPVRVRTGLWGRQLQHYPTGWRRLMYLAVTVGATISLYYLAFANAGVVTLQASEFGFSFVFVTLLAMAGGALAALASLGAGFADKFGRANIVVYGLIASAVLVEVAIPSAHGRWAFSVWASLLAFIEGAVLVATPALIRDFSPQIGRASAMGFWTLGPVLGSLVVSEVASHTLSSHTDWRFQYHVSGAVGLAVAVVAFILLRELSPQIRDQIMVSERERQLVEMKARGVDAEQALQGHWRQMLRRDILLPAFGINMFLWFFYASVVLLVPFFVAAWGYLPDRANGLANWLWSCNAATLIVTGVLSDKLRVRKPFMAIGGVISLVGVGLFAHATSSGGTSYANWRLIIVVVAVGLAMTFAAWMAAFTETVEKHNPAAVATGLSIWGSMLRAVTVVMAIGTLLVLPAMRTLYHDGSRVGQLATGTAPDLTAAQNSIVKEVAANPSIVTRAQSLATKFRAELATAAKMSPGAQADIAAHPDNVAAQVLALTEISGLPQLDVQRIVQDQGTYPAQIRTASAIEPATARRLSAAPTPAALAQAVADVSKNLHISTAAAGARMDSLALVPRYDLNLLAQEGPTVQRAADRLTALGDIPTADLDFLSAHAGLQDPTVVATLKYLQGHAPAVQAAVKQSHSQWSHWWWLCFAVQLLLFPFIGLMTGRWSPRQARIDALEHQWAVERELQQLVATG
jgi:MFS transporter, ACS family, D-galactonate transporter